MKAKSIKPIVLLTLSVAIIVSGCATQKIWMYEPKATPVASSPLLDKSVAVLPFTDMREHSNKNRWAMYLIPLMPFGWQDLAKPEICSVHSLSSGWSFRPAHDFANALVAELKNANFFKDIFFTERPGEADLILEGKILSTRYRSKIFSYGLSVEGPLLWYVGVPSGWFSNEIRIELILKDNATKEVLWQATEECKMAKTTWLYYAPSDFRYPVLFAKIAQNLVASLEKVLRAKTGA